MTDMTFLARYRRRCCALVALPHTHALDSTASASTLARPSPQLRTRQGRTAQLASAHMRSETQLPARSAHTQQGYMRRTCMPARANRRKINGDSSDFTKSQRKQ
eukprot:257990-Rhodomonas_salina.1